MPEALLEDQEKKHVLSRKPIFPQINYQMIITEKQEIITTIFFPLIFGEKVEAGG